MTAALLRILLFFSEVFPALFGLLSPHKVDMQICHLSLLQQDKVSGALCSLHACSHFRRTARSPRRSATLSQCATLRPWERCKGDSFQVVPAAFESTGWLWHIGRIRQMGHMSPHLRLRSPWCKRRADRLGADLRRHSRRSGWFVVDEIATHRSRLARRMGRRTILSSLCCKDCFRKISASLIRVRQKWAAPYLWDFPTSSRQRRGCNRRECRVPL